MLQGLIQECEAEGRTLRVVRHTSQQGVAKSRNTGAQAAQYGLLAYIDSDCVASPGWLTELVPAFRQADVAAVGGMIRAYERESMLGRYEDIRSSLFMGVRPQQVSIEGPLMYLPTANLLVRREMWQQIGGFAPLTFGEDVDFCRRLLATKARILYLPEGIVYHDYRTQVWPFLKIRASYASAEAALLRRYPEERRVLLLPSEQTLFAGLTLGGTWSMLSQQIRRKSESVGSGHESEITLTGRFFGEDGSSSVGAGEVGMWRGDPCGRPLGLPPPPPLRGRGHFPWMFPKKPTPESPQGDALINQDSKERAGFQGA